MKRNDVIKLYKMCYAYNSEGYLNFEFLMESHEEDVEKLKTIIQPYGFQILEQSYSPSTEDWEVITDIPQDIFNNLF